MTANSGMEDIEHNALQFVVSAPDGRQGNSKVTTVQVCLDSGSVTTFDIVKLSSKCIG